MSENIGVFVSSSMKELPDERRVVQSALNNFHRDLHAWLWEDYAVARDPSIQESYLEGVESCQIYLGIFAEQYGEFTIDEFEHAKKIGKPLLVFVKANKEGNKLVPLPGRDPELTDFLNRISDVKTGLTPEWFTDLEDLERRVIRAIYPFVVKLFPEWKVPEWRQKFNIPFVGRLQEIDDLVNILDRPEPVALTALEGIGGLGKTYLALRTAHHLQERLRFPGGIFWLDTFGPNVENAEQALRELARAHPLGRATLQERRPITSEDVHQWLGDAPGRGLVIADDVWHRAPLRELLKALPSKFSLLITTRTGDVVDAAWTTYELQRLNPQDSLKILKNALKLPEDTRDESLALLKQIVDLVDRHGLGLRLAASWLTQPGRGLNAAFDYVERLKKSGSPLKYLEVGDTRNESVEKAFDLSYNDLDDRQQAMFRAMGAFAPASGFTGSALLAVWGEPLPNDEARWEAEDLLSKMVPELLTHEGDLILTGNPRPDRKKQRYTLHALLHAYAKALLKRDNAESFQARHHDFYLQQADNGNLHEEDLPQYRHAFYQATDKVAFFEQLAEHLDKHPFLWGVVHESLAELLNQQEYAFIERWGYMTTTFQSELLTSVLAEHYIKHQEGVYEILTNWLESKDKPLVKQVVANIAIKHQVQTLLERLMKHPEETVRYLFIQDIHALWENNSNLAVQLLEKLAGKVNLFGLYRHLDVLDTLLRSSLLLVMRDYSKIGSETATLQAVLQIWHPVIHRLFLVTSVRPIEYGFKHIRRGLIQLAVNRIVNTLRNLDAASPQSIFSFLDLQTSFPASADRKQVFDRLLPHLDIGAGKPPESVESLVDYVRQRIDEGDEDYLTACVALGCVFIHALFSDPLPVAQQVAQLLKHLETVYPPTTDLNRPTAGVWYPMMGFVLSNIPFDALDREVTKQILLILHENRYTNELRYRSACRFASGFQARGNPVVDSIWGYKFNMPEVGVETLRHFVDLFIKEDDFWQIQQSTYALIEGMNFYGMPEEAFEAIYDLLQMLESYLARLDDKRRREFWEYFTGNMILYAGKYPEHIAAFVERCQNQLLPDFVKIRILNAGNQPDDFNHILVVAIIMFFKDVFKDKNPYGRELIKWAINKALEVKSLQNWVVECVVYLSNLVYGDELFST